MLDKGTMLQDKGTMLQDKGTFKSEKIVRVGTWEDMGRQEKTEGDRGGHGRTRNWVNSHYVKNSFLPLFTA